MLTTWLLVAALYSALVSGLLYLKAASPSGADPGLFRSWPRATLTLALATAASAIVQWRFTSVLAALERDATAIESGEWWRLGTALFVQGGGVAGTVFNLASLLLIGCIAESIWGARRWLAIYLLGGFLSEVVAMAWQPIGAGNSIANFSLAGAVAILCLVRRPTRSALVAASLAFACAGALLLRRDIHGAAMVIGAMIGFLLIGVDRLLKTPGSAAL